ncbi:MAG: retention module-containing protein, partial [Thiobacillus sp.]|nr:retention module-containing protein [Thiobacillus sp.]
MDSSVSTPQAVATVIAIEGQAFARDPSGQMRPLNPGDVLLEGDTIVTMPGGQVQLAFLDGHLLTLLPNETFQFSAETTQTTRPDVSEASLPAGEAGRIIQALERGENIDDLLDPTAAGFEDGGNNSGNDFVRLLRIAEDVTPLAFQFGTRGTDVIPDIPEAESVGSTATSTITPPIVAVTPPPTIRIDDVTVNEDAGTMTFTVSLSHATTAPVSFSYATSNGSATAGADYAATSGAASIATGLTTATFTVAISDDFIREGNETFNVTLSGLSANVAAAGNDLTGVGTITDTLDVTTVSLAATASVAEGGNITYTATLTNAAQGPVTVTLSNGSTITIANGAMTGTVSVPAPTDDVYVDAGSV